MDSTEKLPEEKLPEEREEGASGHVIDLLHRISDDVKVIASDEVELARAELNQSMKAAAADAAVVLLAGIVALIGLGLLCVAAVAALEPVLTRLWLRLLIMAFVYMGLGAGVAAYFGKRLKGDASPEFTRTKAEARRTAEVLKKEVRHG